MASSPSEVAQQLRGLRTRSGLTQRQLAERAGVSIEAISTIERGRKAPRRSTAQLLAAVLDVPADVLFVPRGRAWLRRTRR
jgi:transcriptional regulator with XRE-family HTH domain